MKAPGVNNYEIGGLGGGGGLTKLAATRITYIDANMAVFLKDFMGSDWSRLFGYPDSMDISQPGGGGGGGGGGAGADFGRYVESGSYGIPAIGSFHCMITGSTYGSTPVPASGGNGGAGGPAIGADGSGSVGGSGGGGGGSGGIILIGAQKLRISSSAQLIVSGGRGGNGAQGWDGQDIGSQGGGAGGGGGGAGGVIVVFSTTASAAAGWIPSDPVRFNVYSGIGGAGGAALSSAGGGVDGAHGPIGGTFYIQI